MTAQGGGGVVWPRAESLVYGARMQFPTFTSEAFVPQKNDPLPFDFDPNCAKLGVTHCSIQKFIR
jgi:hypothetical protein